MESVNFPETFFKRVLFSPNDFQRVHEWVWNLMNNINKNDVKSVLNI